MRISEIKYNQLIKHNILILLLSVFTLAGCASINSLDPCVRMRALENIFDQKILAKIALEDVDSDVRCHAVCRITDQILLANIALKDKDENVRCKAIETLTDQDLLIKITLEAQDWKARKTAFNRLSNDSLDTLSHKVKDPAIVKAVKIHSGQSTWEKEFSNIDKQKNALGNIIGAAALIDTPKPPSSVIVKMCHDYIRMGDISRIPELCELLDKYGDKALCEDYLNCGRTELYDAGCKWANDRGFNMQSGVGSHRARWGSGNK